MSWLPARNTIIDMPIPFNGHGRIEQMRQWFAKHATNSVQVL